MSVSTIYLARLRAKYRGPYATCRQFWRLVVSFGEGEYNHTHWKRIIKSIRSIYDCFQSLRIRGYKNRLLRHHATKRFFFGGGGGYFANFGKQVQLQTQHKITLSLMCFLWLWFYSPPPRNKPAKREKEITNGHFSCGRLYVANTE